jgi:hypothetical protein
MGIYREPVPAFAPQSLGAQAYQALWDEIQGKLVAAGAIAEKPVGGYKEIF